MPQLLTDLSMRATIERDSFQLFAGGFTGAQSFGFTASRTKAFYTAVTLTDWEDAEGTVTVTGILSGVTVTSVIVFTGDARRLGMSQQFDTLINVATIGFSSDAGNIRIDAVSRTGQPVEELITVATNVACRITRERFGSLQQSVGEASMDAARIYFFPTQDLKRQDRVVADGDRWKIKGIQESFRLSDGTPYYKVAIVHSEEQT